jgi:peptide deformylase
VKFVFRKCITNLSDSGNQFLHRDSGSLREIGYLTPAKAREFTYERHFDIRQMLGCLRSTSAVMAVRDILLLGNPRLYEICSPVAPEELAELTGTVEDLHDTLMDFRARYGTGRAIAAPQIGVSKRLVYMHVDDPVVFINPIIDVKSAKTIELWDDCMSFPDLLVKVRRHRSCRVIYRDLDWNEHRLMLSDSLAELLQHECDHLNGVLAVERAVDSRAFALRSQRAFFGGG